MMQEFLLLGDPRPQGRPRFYKRGNFIGVYDPKESKEYKQTIAAQIAAQCPVYISDKAVSLEVEFVFARPKSIPKKVIDHVKKPDLDNLLKAVIDAITGIVIRDDSQIVSLNARKEYGDPPQTRLRVYYEK